MSNTVRFSLIRRIHEAEVDACYALILEASLWLRHKGIQQWEEPISRSEFQKAVNLKEVFVLTFDEQIAGSVTLSNHKDFYWGEVTESAIHLHRLVVSRAHKGQDYGKMLLNWSREYAAQEGYKFLRLDCRATNQYLREFYQAQGFTFKGIGQGAQYEYALFEASALS